MVRGKGKAGKGPRKDLVGKTDTTGGQDVGGHQGSNLGGGGGTLGLTDRKINKDQRGD